jgi:Reverse transcriptase (RNA-dependent DNA polymerase)
VASDLHFGHFRAQASNDTLGRCDALMAHIPYRTGYSPIRWQEGRGVMLLKEAGNFNAEKMRTILLLPPDFNFNNKLFGRQLMYHAEEHGLIAPEQYGSRKGLSAIEHCVNKQLTFDLIRQERRPAVLCSNDAKGCYDRIVHSVASLCMQRLGMPIQPIVSMFTTLQQMRHHIRTAYGDSESYFRANQVNPIAIQGVGQGNGAGPQIWAAVSTVVLNLLRDEGNGGYFNCPITGNEFFFVGYSFVDDTDLVVTTRSHGESFENVLDCMQQALSDWEAGLRATGGAIEPKKTFWYGMDFEWKGSEWRYRKKQGFERNLQVPNPEGVVEPLECVEVSEARRTLGVRLAPDGSNNEELRYLLKQAHLWASTIASGHLGRKLSLQSFMTTLRPKIRYPLAATTFTREEASEIDKVLIPTALSQSGINRNFPRDLVFGSKEMGGLGLTEVYTEQGIEGIVRLAQYGRCRQHTVGKLLRASYEWAQMELGCRESIFCLKYSKFGKLLTECTLKATWRFISDEQIVIKAPQAQFEDLRQEDRLLIPCLSEVVSSDVLQVVNRCRVFLRVVSLAEIATPDGQYITANAWLGIRGDRMRSLRWPEQARPTAAEWHLWREALQVAFTSGGNSKFTGRADRGRRKLRHSLGRWLQPEQRQWWLDMESGKLFNSEGTGSLYVRKAQKRTRSQTETFHKVRENVDIPTGAVPVTIAGEGSVVRLEAVSQRLEYVPQGNNPEPWDSDIWSTDSWVLAGATITKGQRQSVANAVRSGQAFGVTDGSFKDGWGTASATIVGENEDHIRLDVVVPGRPEDQCSFRSEAAGMYAVCRVVKAICEEFGVETGAMVVACDGLSPIKRCQIKDDQPSTEF